MKNLYIMGAPGSGKTMVALGLALKFQAEGYRVAYFKPVGAPCLSPDQYDADAVLLKETLQMAAPITDIVPFCAGSSYLSGNRRKEKLAAIEAAFQRVSANADLVIIDGAMFPFVMCSWEMDDISFARRFNAAAVVVIKLEDDFSFDRALFYNEHLQLKGIPIAGNIFNGVPRPLQAKTEGIFVPLLQEKGYPVAGVIPRRAEISAPTVAEYQAALGGEILVGQDRLHLLVEDIVIGAMTLDSALRYLRRSADKAVVLGGDRADLALAALETSTSVLILTGGLYPDVKVLARAEEKGVPVILVHYDTYTAVEKMHRVSRHLRPEDKNGIRITLENIEEYCNWQAILEALKN